jgi:hypothetical protein
MVEIHGRCRARPDSHHWLICMNEYKAAWYSNTLVGIQEHPMKKKELASNKKKRSDGFAKEFGEHIKQDVRRAAVAGGLHIGRQLSRVAAQTTMTGALGTTVRVGGRVGMRVIPVVGYALLAYDLYQFGKWASEKI